MFNEFYKETHRPSGYGPRGDGVPNIFQHEWEFVKLLEIYKQAKPQRVLEVGTYFGGTLWHFIQNAVRGTKIVSCDTFKVGADNRGLFAQWAREREVDLRLIAGDSTKVETVEAVRAEGPFDFCFIDADHFYDPVLSDWTNYGAMVVPGGIVAFHDIWEDKDAHPEIDVQRLWREIQQKGYITQELVCDPPGPWGGIGVVYL